MPWDGVGHKTCGRTRRATYGEWALSSSALQSPVPVAVRTIQLYRVRVAHGVPGQLHELESRHAAGRRRDAQSSAGGMDTERGRVHRCEELFGQKTAYGTNDTQSVCDMQTKRTPPERRWSVWP